MIDIRTLIIIGIFLLDLMILFSFDGTTLDRARFGVTWTVTFLIGAMALYVMYSIGILTMYRYAIVMATEFLSSFVVTRMFVSQHSMVYKRLARRYDR